MPWKAEGKEVLKEVGGKWKHHAWAKNPAKAKGMVRLLHGVKRGWVPSSRRSALSRFVKRNKE